MKKDYMTKEDKLGLARARKLKFLEFTRKTRGSAPELYDREFNDLSVFGGIFPAGISDPGVALETLDELLERDRQRELDGFPKKIKVGRVPAREGKVIIVPTTEEEKLVHGAFEPGSGQGEGTGGEGEGEEGEVIGEQPIEPEPGDEDGEGAGEGGGGEHGIEAEAYEIGRKLTEEFELPNLIDKGKRFAIDQYRYDLTDRHRGAGQILDKKATLRQIIKTNLGLGRIPDINNIDPSRFLIAARDKIYRVLSREKEYVSQAIIFFLRDYSGSMGGKPTQAVISQHLMIYSWLVYQYNERVISRFILHDTEAKEVPDFDTYYRSSIAGGTKVSSAFKLVNKIIEEENLAQDYNIYIFHGTDGDNWGDDDDKFIEELKTSISYANRTGISVVRNGWGSSDQATSVEKAVADSGLLDHDGLFRMAAILADEANEELNIKVIKRLISP